MPSILQWNLRGLRSSLQDLQAVLGQRCPTMVCLQETKLHPETQCSFKGYRVFRRDGPAGAVAHGGVLMAVHCSVPSTQVKLRTTLQAVAARVLLDHRYVTVCSIYLPPGVTLPRLELRQLTAELPSPFLLLGDFNAHSSLWGCRNIDTRGRVLERFVEDELLSIFNTGTRTHFTMPSGTTSAIDLSMENPQLMPLFIWHVGDDLRGCDHFPVWLTYQDVTSLGKRPRRWRR